MYSQLVADSRPQKNAAFLQQWPNLAQAFIGTEIRCDEAVFNPEEVTLMDFHECDDEIQFTYEVVAKLQMGAGFSLKRE